MVRVFQFPFPRPKKLSRRPLEVSLASCAGDDFPVRDNLPTAPSPERIRAGVR